MVSIVHHHAANAIARRALIGNTTKEGLIAGAHHFIDLWARDSLEREIFC